MTEYAVVDPTTNRLVRRFPTATDTEVDAAVDGAAEAFRSWRRRPVAERARFLAAVAGLQRERRHHLAAIITREMGKTTAEALGEVDLCADIHDYYAENAAAFTADRPLDVAEGSATVRTEPIGVLLGIMPWNYPYYQVARFAAPNIALGNTVLLKHAPSCPESAAAIVALFADAGLPEGVYTNLYATEAQVARIIGHPAVQGVSLTGSERAGRAVGELAGRAMKKTVLELGGSDPFIVLADADPERAADAAVVGRMGNAGQACTAAKRFVVLDEVYDAFVAAFVERVAALRVGDPGQEGTDLGPLSSEAAAQHVVGQVEDAVAHGATVLTGGGRPDREGAFVEPTVLTGVAPGTRAYREEIFGPVAVVHRVGSVDEAVALANDTPYGLGGVVFGADENAALAVGDRLDTGMVSVNAPSRTQADLPFGGVKASGVGRELGEYGMAEFVNRKLFRTP
ncbi:NAD-dependent succinate-semialdehyde dehydrogenase [Nocardiopsis ganjiahuensis]|uniref:NAD-dependent succinate-semialdehyde dehydrogenase n=1 Tax=Nocardiopsis ganjiahuensis TaxID=239984 RepID=UPI00034A83B8|nr:NAD-dependent succinate-semialdehyde dehydrogenase [Nocardiopsis ganjiahuensis]